MAVASAVHCAGVRPNGMRVVAHYMAVVAVMAVYGVQVCPFVESLRPAELLPPLMVMVALQYMLRRELLRRYVVPVPYIQQVPRLFRIDALSFVISGALLAAHNTVVFGFPLTSGMKLMVGFATLGFFVSVDLALEWERRLVGHLESSGEQLPSGEHYFPLTRKMAAVAFACAVFMMAVVFLVINKDLDWLVAAGETLPLASARQVILIEIAFVVSVFLLYVLAIIHSFSRNLNVFFRYENEVLERATSGNFDRRVPVGSADEFGVMAHYTNRMIEGLRAATDELKRTRDVTIMSLASLAETRDNETGAHLLRTQRYVRALAEHLRWHPRFRNHLDPDTIMLLFKSAPLHDIGKVGIPDRILLKPSRLSEREFEVMKTHTSLGAAALRAAEAQLGGSSFLRIAREIAETHHERWDGHGYPAGLRGEEIPVSGRLMALADVYDALISERVYKRAFSHAEARAIILEGRERHFDPAVVDAFLSAEGEFVRIAAEFRDEDYPCAVDNETLHA